MAVPLGSFVGFVKVCTRSGWNALDMCIDHYFDWRILQTKDHIVTYAEAIYSSVCGTVFEHVVP